MRKQIWYLLLWGPATLLVALSVWQLLLGQWLVGFGYAIAGLNGWLIARHVPLNYRTGYWRGRADFMAERAGLLPRRDIGDDPNPWDDSSTLDAEVKRILAAHEAWKAQQEKDDESQG
jgi:hypothetical protein